MILGLAATAFLLPAEGASTPNVGAGIFVSVAPALLWLALLYRGTRRSTESLPAIVPSFMLVGVLVAAAVTHPIFRTVLETENWFSRTNALNRFLGSILLNGFFDVFVLYAIIRFLAWNHPSFSHRTDGVLLAMAASLGYSTTLSVFYVIDHAGLTAVNGSLRVLSIGMATVTPGLVLGYFAGHNRFEDMPLHFLVGGVTIAAFINGLLLYAGSELNYTGLGLKQTGFSPWPGVVVNVLALAACFTVVHSLLRRQNSLIKARLEPGL